MAAGGAANTTPGGSVRVATGSHGGGANIDLASLKALLDESIHKATAPLYERIGALQERVDISESRHVSEDESSDDSSSSEGSRASVLDDAAFYVRVDPKSNAHFGASDLANNGEHKPHRHDLYGNKAWMVLSKGGNDTGGSLGFTLSYAEPLALYGKGAWDAADQLAERYAAGADSADPDAFLQDLVALRNTLREQYKLTNLMRSIVVQKARALRPGATEYDKAEVKYLERCLNERDFKQPDMAIEIERLKGNFARRSNKAELERLSKKSGGGGGGGGDAASEVSSDDSSDGGKSKSSRNKKKREKAKAKKRAAKQAADAQAGKSSGTGRGGADESERSLSSRSGNKRRDARGSGDGGDSSSSRRQSAASGGKSTKPKKQSRGARAEAAGGGHDDDDDDGEGFV